MAKPPKDFVYKNQLKTPIFKIFGGKSRSQVHCLGCGHKSNTYEDLVSLSLDLPMSRGGGYGMYGMQKSGGNHINFESCLNNFCSSELLKGENKYSCSNCKKKCEAKKRFSIE
jgi:ubiquitin carboxyl-terminal hydrolase 36/42